MKSLVLLANQIFDLEHKLASDNFMEKYERQFARINNVFEEEGLMIKDPLGEKYTETRTDLEANIVGNDGKNMIVTKVLKPIIYLKENNSYQLLQKGVVIVENK